MELGLGAYALLCWLINKLMDALATPPAPRAVVEAVLIVVLVLGYGLLGPSFPFHR